MSYLIIFRKSLSYISAEIRHLYGNISQINILLEKKIIKK